MSRGNGYKLLNNMELAEEDYSSAIALTPSAIDIVYNRGVVRKAQQKLDEAISDFSDVIAKRPRDAYAFINRGTSYRDKGDSQRALEDCTQAVKLRPNADSYDCRATTYDIAGQLDLALADFNEAIRLNPKAAWCYGNRGQTLAKKGDLDAALLDFEKALKLDPDTDFPRLQRIDALSRSGRHGETLRDLDIMIQRDVASPRFYWIRATAHLKLGNAEQANADLARVIELDPRDPEPLEARGDLHEARGDQAAALADYRAAVALTPRSDTEKAAISKAQARIAALTAVPSAPQPTTATPVVSAPASAASGPLTRVALVIGNSTYGAVAHLPNPQRDADAVAQTLRRLGFKTVRAASDLGADAMRRALLEFGEEAAGADWAVVYYAGHGIEVDGSNYLVPTDARLRSDRDVALETIGLDHVLRSVEGARRLRVVILDACRDNPFLAKMSRTVASRSIGRGLARVEPEGATLVAYSAKGGQIALDGRSGNSPFVTALLRHIETPGVEINRLFRLVRDEVMAASGGAQEPFVYGSLPAEEFFFKTAP